MRLERSRRQKVADEQTVQLKKTTTATRTIITKSAFHVVGDKNNALSTPLYQIHKEHWKQNRNEAVFNRILFFNHLFFHIFLPFLIGFRWFLFCSTTLNLKDAANNDKRLIVCVYLLVTDYKGKERNMNLNKIDDGEAELKFSWSQIDFRIAWCGSVEATMKPWNNLIFSRPIVYCTELLKSRWKVYLRVVWPPILTLISLIFMILLSNTVSKRAPIKN